MDWRFDGLTALVSKAAGKAADLVVLAGNRAKNIDDVERVETVFKDGVGYDPARPRINLPDDRHGLYVEERMMPLFSIILPTYNRAYVLWRAIQSILAQTESRWELLVVDDGSTDDTRRLIEEFQDPRLRTVVTENRGPSAARNLGARLTRAPYLAYLDSDNTWHPEFLATMLDAMESHPTKVLWYCGQHTRMWRREAGGEWKIELEQDDLRAQYTLEEALQLKSPDTNCMVHTREVLAETGGWDEACRWLEDWDFFTRCLIRYPEGVHWIAKVMVEYRQVYGVDVDGLCATTVQDAARKRAGWQYLVDKWRHHPGFSATAERLTSKYLR